MSTVISNRLQIALKNMEFARGYTMSLVEDLSESDWFWTPSPAVTHVGWQVGHIAMAQYGLTLFRVRGRQSIDQELMSGKFRKQFFKGTTPSPNAGDYPPPEEILQVLHGVYDQMQKELPGFTDEQLDAPAEMPTAGFATNFGGLLFAADHEMLHAGQIGLLRRLMGKAPIR